MAWLKPEMDEVREALRGVAPWFADEPIAFMAEGWEFWAFEVDGYVVRFPKNEVSVAQLAKLIQLVAAGQVNRNTAKALLPKLRGTSQDPAALVAAEGLGQVSDRGALEAIVADVIARSPEQVAQFKAGKDKVIGFLVGQVMKASGGKAAPQVVQELLRAALAR